MKFVKYCNGTRCFFCKMGILTCECGCKEGHWVINEEIFTTAQIGCAVGVYFCNRKQKEPSCMMITEAASNKTSIAQDLKENQTKRNRHFNTHRHVCHFGTTFFNQEGEGQLIEPQCTIYSPKSPKSCSDVPDTKAKVTSI